MAVITMYGLEPTKHLVVLVAAGAWSSVLSCGQRGGGLNQQVTCVDHHLCYLCVFL